MPTLFPIPINPTWQHPTVCIIYRLNQESFLTLGLRDMDPIPLCLSPVQGFASEEIAIEAVHAFAIRTNTRSPLALEGKDLIECCRVYTLEPSSIQAAVFTLSERKRGLPKKIREPYDLVVF